MQDIYRALGAAVRARRKRLGWTIEELGDAAGLHPGYVGQIERGTKKASLRTAALLASALRTTLGVLLEEPARAGNPWKERIYALLSDASGSQQRIMYSTLRHLSKELGGR